MEKIQPVINWFTDRGGKVIGNCSADEFKPEVENANEDLIEVSDNYAEIGACSISDELFNYLANGGPLPAGWAEEREKDKKAFEKAQTDKTNKLDSDDDTEVEFMPDEIERSALNEIAYRGLQIFLGEIFFEDDTSTVSIQFLLDHGRDDNDDDTSLEDAINELEPLLPQGAEFEIWHSIGTDVFLMCELTSEELKPEKLDAILAPLTKFAEFATTKVSILHLVPEFKLKATHS